ncbi:hypothetical protein IWC96_05165 [Brevundimonas sp. BAL450]|uniref:hypothetical protein n=1 Tax=Brevundimonas sp. BAL450 TaxID=1708162 RepID=UPI0018CBDD74|nr:hypothetical protein [Brevundimonas sp. BAL450]MBG7614671.1 hypothetical protein [Brevundimonas sp. BAL450]
MRGVLPILAVLVLGACAQADDTVETFAADQTAAEAAVADCAGGRRTLDCDAAREGLAQGRSRDREALYRQAF